jgi:hypothetical protein
MPIFQLASNELKPLSQTSFGAEGIMERKDIQELIWQELPEGDGCRIRLVTDGGYRSPPEQWAGIHAKLVDAMVRPATTFATPHAELNRHATYPPRADFGARTASMPLLRTTTTEAGRAD